MGIPVAARSGRVCDNIWWWKTILIIFVVIIIIIILLPLNGFWCRNSDIPRWWWWSTSSDRGNFSVTVFKRRFLSLCFSLFFVLLECNFVLYIQKCNLTCLWCSYMFVNSLFYHLLSMANSGSSLLIFVLFLFHWIFFFLVIVLSFYDEGIHWGYNFWLVIFLCIINLNVEMKFIWK